MNSQTISPNKYFLRDSSLIKMFYHLLSFLLAIPPVVLYFFLFLSLLVLEYYNFNLNPDLSVQLSTMVNLVRGHGITLAEISKHELIYKSFSQWPAGLVFFLLPFYLITRSTITSVLILNSLCYWFYIIYLNKTFKYLKITVLKQKFIIVFLSISVSPFIHFYPSDTLATILCLWGFYWNLKFLNNRKYSSLIRSLCLLSISYFVKYSFLPYLFCPLLSFIIKERRSLFKRVKQALIILLLTLVLLFFFYSLNNFLVGSNDINNLTTHFDLFKGRSHWNQLSHFDGFLFAFGIYEWVFENFLKNHFALNIQFNWISILLTTYCYTRIVKAFFKVSEEVVNPFSNFLNVFLSSSFLIICFLSFLTLNNPGQTWKKPYWTFVEESRYYGPIIIIGLISILLIFLNEKKGRLIHILVPLLIVFNIYAWRTVKNLGFWGNNFMSYSASKNEMNQRISGFTKNTDVIIFYEPNMKYSPPFLILQSTGEILLNNNLPFDKKLYKDKFKFILLKKDSINSYRISKIE